MYLLQDSSRTNSTKDHLNRGSIYPLNTEQSSVPQRLESIENQLKLLGDDLNQVRNLLTMILDKVS